MFFLNAKENNKRNLIYQYGRNEIMFDAIWDNSEDVEKQSKLV